MDEWDKPEISRLIEILETPQSGSHYPLHHTIRAGFAASLMEMGLRAEDVGTAKRIGKALRKNGFLEGYNALCAKTGETPVHFECPKNPMSRPPAAAAGKDVAPRPLTRQSGAPGIIRGK